jgi:hypothetical protein
VAGKGKPENLKPWPKGVSGNPGGRPKRQFTAEDVGLVIEKYMLLPQGELQAIYEDKETNGVNALAAGAVLEAIRAKDWNAVRDMLDRSIGKVKDISEVHQHNYDDEFDKAPKENIIELLRKSSSK